MQYQFSGFILDTEKLGVSRDKIHQALVAEGLSGVSDDMDFEEKLDEQFWEPVYLDYQYDPAVA